MNGSSPLKKLLLIIVLPALLAACLLVLTPGREVRAQDPDNMDRIKYVIYPTIGFPAIVNCGSTLVIEYDPRNQAFGQPFVEIKDFQVSVTTSNGDYPVTEALPVESFKKGSSSRWPLLVNNSSAQIYLVTVTVPHDLPFDLYDLFVNGQKKDDGTWIEDSQPHALQTIEDYQDPFSFCQLTDMHVWGPEVGYFWGCPWNKDGRNYRHEDWSPDDGYGASYYHKAIQQVNVLKPDFCVLTGDFDLGIWQLDQVDYGDIDQYKNTPFDGTWYENHFEMDWFYEETLKLDVPVFMTIGNHDGNARYGSNDKLEEDFIKTYENLFGPQYYSFDYGPDYEFLALNSMDWAVKDRKMKQIIKCSPCIPGETQGQLLAGGDPWEDGGWTQGREQTDVDEGDFTGQLLWMKNQLENSQSAKMRTCAMHHDPWKYEGSGLMWQTSGMDYGDGEGQVASIKLMRENKVALEISGHAHSDSYGEKGWEDHAGNPIPGTTMFVNTTSIQFDKTSNNWSYPGYRRIWVDDGSVDNFYYKIKKDMNDDDLQWSTPTYKDTVVGGESDYDSMVDPKVQTSWNPDPPGSAENVTCTVKNYLHGEEFADGSGQWSGDMPNAYLEFPMPYLTGNYYYEVTGGTFGDIYDSGGEPPSRRVYQVYTDIDHAPNESTATVKDVSVNKSAGPDEDDPTVDDFQIISSDPTNADVTLTITASDTGGSGVLDMMISNDASFTGATWERYRTTRNWTLETGAGNKTVYVKVRDGAMPANESAPDSATTYLGPAPTFDSFNPGEGKYGDTITIGGQDFGDPQSRRSYVDFNGGRTAESDIVSWTDTEIQCKVPYGATTGKVSVTTDAGTATSAGDFHVVPAISSISPEEGNNNGTVEIKSLTGTGFYSGAGFPIVKLKKGAGAIDGTGVKVVSANKITCSFDLNGAGVGTWDIYVENADSRSCTLPGAFAVEYPPPTVKNVTPHVGTNDEKVDISNLSGGHFRPGASVELQMKGKPDITATDVKVPSSSQITGTVDLKGVAPGAYDVVVANDDGKSGTRQGGFVVNKAEAPRIQSLSPDNGPPGTAVTIQGKEFDTSRDSSYVMFNKTRCQDSDYVSWSDPNIKVKVPEGAKDGQVTVTTVHGTSDGADFFVTNPTWYLAEGSTDWGFDTYVTIENPNSSEVTVEITYMTPQGSIQRPDLRLPAMSQTTIDPGNDIGAVDFSTMVRCKENKEIAVDRRMLWTGPGAASQEGHSSIGVPAPARTWYLAEGSSNWGFECWLLIQNPNDTDVTATVTYMMEGGELAVFTKNIPANSRQSYNMADDIGAEDASIKVDADLPIIPERSMYRDNRREGHDSIGTTTPSTDYYLAEGTTDYGFTTYVLVQNPNDEPANVTVTYMTDKGPVSQPAFQMPANSRQTIDVNDQMPAVDLSTHVRADRPIIAERAMYWGEGTPLGEACHDSIGMPAAHDTFYLPDGETQSGYETWTLVQNPNVGDVEIMITYLTPTGEGDVKFTDTVPAASRKTYSMADKLGVGKASVVVECITQGKSIMVERSMYWNSMGAGTCTIGGYSD